MRRDRRRNRRFTWNQEIRFRVDLGVFRAGRVVNVSSSGLGLFLPFPVADRTRIQLHYYSDRLAPHGLVGEVVRCSPHSHGYAIGLRVRLAGKGDGVPFIRTLRRLEESFVLNTPAPPHPTQPLQAQPRVPEPWTLPNRHRLAR